MSQPTPYNQSTDFSDYQDANPLAPFNGANHDTEFQNLELTLLQILANLALLQRDDGLLKNLLVTPDSLSAGVKSLLAVSTGSTLAPWATATAYTVKDSWVTESSKLYVCLESHTAGVFATDLAAGKWLAVNNDVGVDVQAYDAELAAIAGLVSAASKIPYFTGSGTAGLLDLLDEDDMASDSATGVPTQQSAKAFSESILSMGAAQATTSGTEITFTAPRSGVKRVTVTLSQVSVDAAVGLIFKLGDSGGIETTGYESLGVATNASTNSTTTRNYGLIATNNVLSVNYEMTGVVEFILLDSSTNTWVMKSNLHDYANSIHWEAQGLKSLSGELTTVLLDLDGGGNFDNGKAGVQWHY